MKRAMCVYLPHWPIQRLKHARPELHQQALAITQPVPGRGAKILLCCERAMRTGVRPGMPVAEARAIAPRLCLCPEDQASDLRELQKLAAWAERYSPIVGLDEGPTPECLLLDVTGCAPCFHGEDRLASLAVYEFRQQGWTVRIAIADTLGAAWGISRQEDISRQQAAGSRQEEADGSGPHEAVVIIPSCLLPADRCLLMSACCTLPAAACRLPDGTLQMLTALGIERVGDLMEVPREEVAERFGSLVLRRLDQMLGRVPELIVPCRVRPEVQARCSFEYATDSRAVLEHALDPLLDRIVAMLCEHQHGAKHLECWFDHESAPPSRLEVRLFRPSSSVEHLRKLLGTRLEQMQIAESVTGICVRVPVVEIMAGRQVELFEEEPGAEELAALIDRLVSRLGRDAVTFATLVADPQPEYACRFVSALKEREVRSEKRAKKGKKRVSDFLPVLTSGPLTPRPFTLISHPEAIEVLSLAPEGMPARLRRAGKEHAVRRSWGPERIEAGWWRGHDVQRDYYIVETGDGPRWWIFRRLEDGGWFVHGCFD